MDPQVFRCKVLNTLHVQEVFFALFEVEKMDPQVFRCKVLSILHVQQVFLFVCLKLDRWTQRYLGAKAQNYFKANALIDKLSLHGLCVLYLKK